MSIEAMRERLKAKQLRLIQLETSASPSMCRMALELGGDSIEAVRLIRENRKNGLNLGLEFRLRRIEKACGLRD